MTRMPQQAHNTKPPEIRDARAADFDAIVSLNRSEVQHTSAMDAGRLSALHSLSCLHKVVCVDGEVVAFLLAMCAGAPYENVNFEWFGARYADFLYIDRVVVARSARGLGLASRLYTLLFEYARCHDIAFVTCEYNIEPPNEPSRLFHDKFGFSEQGRQWVAGGTKQVSLQAARVGQPGFAGNPVT